MNFSFLNPLFLIGFAAVALPFIAHLISRKSGVVQKFPAVRFLIASQGDASARSRLKDLLLLMLRALIIVLLVLVFSKPAFFSFAPAGSSGPGALAIVIDNSFSMGYGDNFERARKKASGLIDSLPDGSFGITAPLVGGEGARLAPAGDTAGMREALDGIKLSYSYADNEKRLEEAYSALEGAPGRSKEVVFLTDLQKNGWTGRKFEKDWLRIIDVSGGAAPANHAVTDTASGYSGDLATLGMTVSNFSEKEEKGLLASINAGGEDLSAFIDVPPGGSVRKEFTVPGDFLSADRKKEGTARIPRDNLPVDDTRYFVLSGREGFNVLIVDGDAREEARLSETYYLASAAETVSEISGARVTVKDNDSFLEEKLSGYDLVFLANVGDISEESAKELGEFVSRGGTAVIFLGDRVRSTSYNALLGSVMPGELVTEEERETKIVPGAVSVYPKDVADRLGQVEVRRYFKTVPHPESEVMLGLEGGDPFLLRNALGRGSVFLVTSTADTGWSSFAISTVFLPVVKWFLDVPGSSNEKRRNYTVGDGVPLDISPGSDSVEVISPSGKKYVRGMTAPVFEETGEPGIYTVRESGKDSYKFAVNVNPSESDLRKIEIPQDEPAAAGDQGLVKIYREIWRYFLWGAVLLFISEAAARAAFS